ncbi:MAG: glycosyltransferase family 4 protein [Candidatus Omnitrophota bacterium]|nr:glycosyltransferase family 4 protein [Candidatus Omnitrophota bacterium]
MRIFAANQFISDLNESSSEKGLYGAWVATSDFYKNLLRFGTFDEYNFFILPEDKKKHLLSKSLIPYANNKKIKFKKITHLPAFLRDTDNFIFFTCSPSLFYIANLRSLHAKKYFPICGLTHTISYARLISRDFFYNIVSDLEAFDSIICTSKSVLESLRQIHQLIRKDFSRKFCVNLKFKARLDQLPLGVNSQDYNQNNKNASRKRLGLPGKKIIIIYFGRLSISDKADLYPLLFTFRNLLKENKNILLVLAGKNFPGRYTEKVKKIAREMEISKYMRFFINPSHNEKCLLYSASDIYVSPVDNPQESFGLTVLEAMAAGLPLVVSNWGGYKDIAKHTKTGFLIPTFWADCNRQTADYTYLFDSYSSIESFALGQSVCVDIGKMTEYLNLLIKNKDLRSKMGSNAREYVFKNYDWSVVIPKYERLWDELIDETKAYKKSPKREPLFYPKYFECFKHYSSHILNKRTHIIITEEGIQLLKTREFPAGIPSLGLIAPKIVLLILFYLKERQGSSLEKIKDHINEFFKEMSWDRINYHIMWMLKYYLTELA